MNEQVPQPWPRRESPTPVAFEHCKGCLAGPLDAWQCPARGCKMLPETLHSDGRATDEASLAPMRDEVRIGYVLDDFGGLGGNANRERLAPRLLALLAAVRRETVEACAKRAEGTQPVMTGSGGIGIPSTVVYQPNPYAATCAANIRALLSVSPASESQEKTR